MYGLTSTLSVASEALNADSGAIAITNNNISNANTNGYTRQIVDLSSSALTGSGLPQDNGVTFAGYASVRDELLQLGINQKTSDVGSLTAQSTSWAQIENAFSGTGTGINAALSNFFSSVSGLSTDPNSAAARQTTLNAAGQVAAAFNQAAAALSQTQGSADQDVSGMVTQVNQLTSQIANLDKQLQQTAGSGRDGGSVQDQRDQLTTQLAQLVGLNVIQTNSTPTLALSDGTPLVSGGGAYSLQTATEVDGKTHVLNSAGTDMTSTLSGGSLGGSIQMRDQDVPAVQNTLDQLATQLAQAVNTAQSTGYDSTGNPGQPLFSLSSTSGAAASLTVALGSGAGIAASSSSNTGDSGNVSNLLAIETQNLATGESPAQTYASLVQSIGSSSADVTANLNAATAALSQLTTQQGSESGVSIDEETTNLLRYQQAYSAAAQVISTINALFSVTLNMMTVTG